MAVFEEQGNDFQLLEEQRCHGKVAVMAWCPTMDLVAMALRNGQIHLRRLSWQRVWVIDTLEEQPVATALCWSVDGRELAIGYENGRVAIHHVETSHATAVVQLNSRIIHLHWKQTKLATVFDQSFAGLPPLPTERLKNGDKDPPDNISSSDTLSLLYAATEDGQVHILGLGTLLLGSLALPGKVEVHALAAAPDLSALSLLARDDERRMHIVHYPLTSLSSRFGLTSQVINLTQHLTSLCQHVSLAVQDMLDSNQLPLKQLNKPLNQLREQLGGTEPMVRSMLDLLARGKNDDLEMQALLTTGMNVRLLNQASSALTAVFTEVDSLFTNHVSRCLEHIMAATNTALDLLQQQAPITMHPQYASLRRLQSLVETMYRRMHGYRTMIAEHKDGVLLLLDWFLHMHQAAQQDANATPQPLFKRIGDLALYLPSFSRLQLKGIDFNPVPQILASIPPKGAQLVPEPEISSNASLVSTCLPVEAPITIEELNASIPQLTYLPLLSAVYELQQAGLVFCDDERVVKLEQVSSINVPDGLSQLAHAMCDACKQLGRDLSDTVKNIQPTSHVLALNTHSCQGSLRYTNDGVIMAALATTPHRVCTGVVHQDGRANFAQLNVTGHDIKAIEPYKDAIAVLTAAADGDGSGIAILDDDELTERLDDRNGNGANLPISSDLPCTVSPTSSRVIDGSFENMAVSLRQIGILLLNGGEMARLIDFAGEEDDDSDEDAESE
eukprot:TRINITY_DN10803_c0_g1_i3.p1 TRINITY_DN10803_c0_g1~~TRINITY_DN10803_c0_g1_i3.p1  ORF type:complete len:728 (+),score=159.89 TRINITY_DN10803_c0_g1_i3:53-2236(+)